MPMPHPTCLAENRADPDVSILQVGRCVSMQREHFVPGKNVIGHPILREIGVLDRADADLVGDVDFLAFA